MGTEEILKKREKILIFSVLRKYTNMQRKGIPIFFASSVSAISKLVYME